MSIIERILLVEGGYVNDPHDPGGETKYGISKRSFPDEDIPNLTKERARELLIQHYIVEPGFDTLPAGPLRDQLVDYAYHSGPAAAIRALQRQLRVPIDGILGPRTLAKLLTWDLPLLNNLLVKQRVLFLADLVHRTPVKVKFLNGWLKRALDFIM